MASHEDIVLNFLQEHPNSSPLEVAKALKAADDSVEVSRKLGNAILYKLQKKKKVVKTSNPDGTKPKWSTASPKEAKKIYTRETFVTESIQSIKALRGKIPQDLLPEQLSDLLDVVEDLRSALEATEITESQTTVDAPPESSEDLIEEVSA